MANKLDKELQTLVQRSATNTGGMRTESQRASFARNVRADIASIMYQLNVVYKELASSLSSREGINALDFGLSGNVMFTHASATEADAEAYYSETNARSKTIKETIDSILSELVRLENLIQAAEDATAYDDTELRGLVATNGLDLIQLAGDSMGPNYTLDGDGRTNISYSLSQAIDAIGSHFSGFPTTGNTYTSAYPTLSLTVLLSAVTIDTTLPQATITGLTADLGYIRDFIGMSTTGPESPVYSFHSGNAFISNGWTLEQAIAEIDTQLGDHDARHESGGADEIDGDRLDIDFVPVNYTRTTTVQANSVDHLTAHLKGLDNALGAKTMQQTYDDGSAGTAGVIELDNSRGSISIEDDAAAPLGHLLEWVNGTGSKIGTLNKDGVQVQNGGYYCQESLGSDPTAIAGKGIYNARPDVDSAKVEAFYQNSDGSDSNAQITRDGIVKELEVGHDQVLAGAWQVFSGQSAAKHIMEYGSSPAGVVIQTLDFDSSSAEYAYAVVHAPSDEDGNVPTRFKCTASFITKPDGGPYPGGTGVVFGLAFSNGSGIRTLGNGADVNPGWSAEATAQQTGMDASWVDSYVVLEFPEQTLTTNPNGMLHFRLGRSVADPNDDWAADVGLVSMKVVWYR